MGATPFPAGALRRSSTCATCARSRRGSSSSTSGRASTQRRSCVTRYGRSRARSARSSAARGGEGFERTLLVWRLSVARAARPSSTRVLDSRAVEPVVYRPISCPRSPHGELAGMPLQPIASSKQKQMSGESTIEIVQAYRPRLTDLEGFSHLSGWSCTCTRAPAGTRRCRPFSTSACTWDVRHEVALRRPNPSPVACTDRRASATSRSS